MINYVLSIETGVTDLVRTPEYYQTATFVQKKEELLALIYQKKKLKPFASMKLHQPLAVTRSFKQDRNDVRPILFPNLHRQREQHRTHALWLDRQRDR